MEEGKFSRLHFYVKANLVLGQTLSLSGNVWGLGHFNTSNTITLVTSPESYPIWRTSEPIIVRKGLKIQYRYVIMEYGNIKQEKLETIRSFTPMALDEEIEDEFSIAKADSDAELTLLKEIKDLCDSSDTIPDFIQQNSTPFPSLGKLFLICYHLPINIKRIDPSSSKYSKKCPFEIEWAESLIAKSNNSISNDLDTYWIGTISVPSPAPTDEEMEIITALLAELKCIPVHLEASVKVGAYNGYCKTVMWPIFHNVDQLDQIHAAWNVNALGSSLQTVEWNKDHDRYWSDFEAANAAFAKILEKLDTGKNDVLWIHDYHLMLLPEMIRSKNKDIKIIFFMHIPFPTSQIFRAIPSASTLLSSILSADVIGFHAYDYTRHFLNACKRMLGYRTSTKKGGMLMLNVKDREVVVTMNHVSIEPDTVDSALANPLTKKLAEELKAKYEGKKIVVGVDPCDRLSGGSLKLAAFEKLLTDYSNASVVLVQRNIRRNARIGDESTTSADMISQVNALNSKFPGPEGQVVVDYEEVPSLSIIERCALWLAADVFLLTSIREGMNMMPAEYIYARKDLPYAGCVVASEFSTCSSLLSGSLKINPFYALHVADTLDKALTMSEKECEYRRQRDIAFISSHPSAEWTKQILMDLSYLNKSKEKKVQDSDLKLPEPLNVKSLLSSYMKAEVSGINRKLNRVFIFDYGGTLLHKEKSDVYIKQTLSAIAGRRPSDGMMEALRKLNSDPQNAILIVTGLTKIKLGDTFKGLENITLATSNGLVYSWGKNLLTCEESEQLEISMGTIKEAEVIENSLESQLEAAIVARNRVRSRSFTASILLDDDNHMSAAALAVFQDPLGRSWTASDYKIDWIAVRNIAVPITTKFTFRTNGTCQSPRIPGIGWSYFGADPDWGESQAKQIKIELETALINHDVMVTSLIQGSIEVVPKGLHKGVIAKAFLERVLEFRGGKLPLFTCVIGDEPSDDKLFEAFYDIFGSTKAGNGGEKMDAYTITVGSRLCPAEYYSNDVADVESILTQLAANTTTQVVKAFM